MKQYLSLVKFSHTVFALPFAIIGFFLATHHFGFPFESRILFLVLACMVFARSAAMAFNRLVDRDIDLANPRTANREIPAGLISVSSARLFIAGNCLLFVLCTYFINPLCFYLSPVALAVILGYSFSKRYTALCHFILGVGLALAPIGAFLAVSEKFELLPILFGFVVLFWVSGFDIIYALQDEDFDKGQSLFSVPTYLGKSRSLMLSRTLHFLTSLILLAIGFLGGFGYLYWLGTASFICLLIYQHSIVGSGDLSRINLAFFTTNGLASVIFAFFFVLEMFF